MCVAGNISSGLQLRVQGNKDLADQLLLHPRNKGYKGLADQVLLQALFNQMLLRAHICVAEHPKVKCWVQLSIDLSYNAHACARSNS